MMINIEWVQRLESVRSQLTKREQEIVNYLEEHFESLPQLSMQDVVDATNTSRPTVHRFCGKMGYNGFKAFKQAMFHLSQSLKSPVLDFTPRTLTPKIASDDAVAEINSSFELFQKGFTVDIQALQRTAVTFSEPQIARIVEYIRQANTLYCVGYESAMFPARFLAERLSRLQKKVQIATGEQRHILDLLFSITAGDLLFLFEYHKSFDLDVKLLERSRKRGAKTVVMTDYPTSPVVTRADETLIVHRGLPGFKNSMAVPMTVVNNLLLAVEFALGDKRAEYLQEWDAWNM
jgi:DNA-binding MurR/RpiR family transcriptional regulator